MRGDWSSFNSGKLFCHVGRWGNIRRGGECPPPVLVTVDPSNACNLGCSWCNAYKVRKNNRMLSHKVLTDFAEMLPGWSSSDGRYGVRAVCVAGGGEPLMNPYVGEFIAKLDAGGIAVATVTNGVFVNEWIEALLVNQYVAVSVDAATPETFNKYKGVPASLRLFDRVIANMEKLCEASRKAPCNLGRRSPSNGVNYRMLLYKDNIGEIAEAAKIAQEIGCSNLHVRPACVPYDGNDEFEFSDEDIGLFREQARIVEETKRPGFGFHCTLDKFDESFRKHNDFDSCHAVFMTATLMPPSGAEAPADSFRLNVCCDRRSDVGMELLTNEGDVASIPLAWGGERHWQIFDSVGADQIRRTCPRCTYYEHNKIFESCVESDDMLVDFI